MDFLKRLGNLKNWQMLGIWGFIIVLIYGQSISFDFFVVDDAFHVRDKIHFNPFTWGKMFQLWSESLIPVPYTLWGIGVFFFGSKNPVPFHILNIIVYIIACWFFYHFLRNLFSVKFKEDLFKINFSSFVATIIFILHPLHIEPVVWISGLKDLSALVFFLVALNFYLKFRQILWWRYYFFSLIAIMFAILSKVSALVFFPIIIILDYFWVDIRKFEKYIVHLPSLICSIIFCYLYYNRYHVTVGVYSVIEKIGVMIFSLIVYFTKIVIPFDLGFDYGFTVNNILQRLEDFRSSQLMIIFFILICGIIITLKIVKKIDHLFWILLLMIITLLPNLGLVQHNFQIISVVADRYALLATVIFCVGIAMAIIYNYEFIIDRKGKRIFYIVLAMLGFYYVIINVRYVPTWKNSESILQNSIKNAPQSYASNYALSLVLWEQNRLDEALKYHLQALVNNPYEFDILVEFVSKMALLGRIDDFQEMYQNYLKPYYRGRAEFLTRLIDLCSSTNIHFRFVEDRVKLVNFLRNNL